MSDEKSPVLENQGDAPDLRQKESPSNLIWLFICIIVSTAWFTRSHSQLSPLSIEERAQKILSQTPLIDGHDDLPILVRELFHNRVNDHNFTEAFVKGKFPGHVDIPRLKQGRVGGTFWSVFVPCPENGTDFSDKNYAASVRETMEQVDIMSRIQQAYPKVFSTPPNGTTAMSAFREGKIISPLGIEGLHSIGNSMAHLRIFHELGVSYATLTHNCHNRYADAAILELPGGGIKKSDPLWHGVSEEGQKLVFEMNRLGMIVDLAHVSTETMRDVLGAGKSEWIGSRAPVIYSHSSAYALCPHPRNVPDDILELVREKNSLVMVNFAPDFISCTASDRADGIPDADPVHATLERVADHILYIGNLIGFEHVGIGSDFDGIPTVPRGLEDVSKFPNLIKELLKRGVSDIDASRVVGGNLLRVWKKVDEVALEMQAEGALPMED
ncbi:Peptidase M19 renal dipeptidase [Penicillium cf. griseofulvum]|uniref:Dipeptidase n=1 Tax=Penicillium cf. griseofulvum TaxID=2972120 RepID=A0A9W9MGI1_9EURO|nr:Peptidase M19 renal dipeptidase [Penicillium cf. griseofulvum]KAJ5431603.1 Peptidase M19 renal dipeptidase [Penicillium cf. griseofulvum]